MPRFVILEHDHPKLHWDFMLESGDHLRAWRLLAAPQTGIAIPAEPSFDHRLFYLDYEGAISGDRGTVTRWDSGTYTWLISDPPPFKLMLSGRRISGAALLTEAGWLFGS